MTDRTRDQLSPAPDGRSADQQPAWRQDFPIDIPEDHFVSRRDFTRFVGLTSLAFVVGQFWILALSWLRRRQGVPAAQAIARLEDIPIGGTVSFKYPGPHDSCLLLRPTADTLVAYDQRCTHLSCAVVPAPARNCLLCPCHQGVFDLTTGRPLAGPPRRPLARILVKVEDGTVYATGVELRTI